MLIRIIKSAPGAVYELGALIRTGDKQAQYLIAQGFAESADDTILEQPQRTIEKRERGNPFMRPPLFIHKCGYVAKNQTDLDEHARSCH